MLSGRTTRKHFSCPPCGTVAKHFALHRGTTLNRLPCELSRKQLSCRPLTCSAIGGERVGPDLALAQLWPCSVSNWRWPTPRPGAKGLSSCRYIGGTARIACGRHLEWLAEK